MAETVYDPTLDALRQKIREQMNYIADNMLTGSCPDYAAYKHVTGQIQGLAWAERALLDLDQEKLKS